ncbi:hypothetical protein C5E08_03220 [Rathayibacter iranicus]|uniref:Transposase DDE domain-containing protein n=1 Tax=Rathayibacter iranicus TaxID=59737 RepID=A0AAD1ELG4_9MICO|nr:hypothetical protein C7V51_03215 [Rathayibacter iranicus]MWV32270.1 hypothetical protein [Rathayibacter iranicus NCPPB 2253 = VKM Ac-1602]PPI62390.1 hypothetical protein C5E08_03220 [Rathayibacter iranicus]
MKNCGAHPRVHVDTAPVAAVGQAGSVLLTEAARATGLERVLSVALAPWRKPFAVHDPRKVIADLAIALALGRDALADIGVLRSMGRAPTAGLERGRGSRGGTSAVFRAVARCGGCSCLAHHGVGGGAGGLTDRRDRAHGRPVGRPGRRCRLAAAGRHDGDPGRPGHPFELEGDQPRVRDEERRLARSGMLHRA